MIFDFRWLSCIIIKDSHQRWSKTNLINIFNILTSGYIMIINPWPQPLKTLQSDHQWSPPHPCLHLEKLVMAVPHLGYSSQDWFWLAGVWKIPNNTCWWLQTFFMFTPTWRNDPVCWWVSFYFFRDSAHLHFGSTEHTVVLTCPESGQPVDTANLVHWIFSICIVLNIMYKKLYVSTYISIETNTWYIQ